MENFTVVASSNACYDKYPDNKPTNFENYLAHERVLEGRWEVAPIQITITNNLSHFEKSVRYGFLVVTRNRGDTKDTIYIITHLYNFKSFIEFYLVRKTAGSTKFEYENAIRIEKSGHTTAKRFYTGPLSLCSEIETAFSTDTALKLRFVYDEKTNRFSIKGENCKVTMFAETPEIFQWLGFNNYETLRFSDLSEEKAYAKYTVPLDYLQSSPEAHIQEIYYITNELIAKDEPKMESLQTVMLYGDFVERGYTGGVLRQYLGSFPLEDPYASPITYTWLQPQYQRVSATALNSVGILLRSDVGTPLPLESGKTFLVLRFHRID